MESSEKNSILIVDDEKNNLDTLSLVLSSEYKIFKAEDGISAIDMAINHLPDVIVLDILMPGMSGYEVLAELKKSVKTRSIPVIILTGLDSADEEEKGLALDAADFIYKPLNAKIIKLRVRNQIQIVNQIRAIKKYAHEVAASEERSKFFARMSHEMRTPLNAVLGLSEMILDEGGISEEARENLEKISGSGASLLGLVNDILDISKIESGMFKLISGEYDLCAALSDVINQSIIIKGEKPIEFIIDIDENLPAFLFGDDLRIKQILNNLLSNAFKYTKEGSVKMIVKGEISSSNKEDIVLTLSVIDTGIGIESEYIDRVFSEYVQADLKANKYTEGTGLGLSITKMMTDMMSGKISVQSEHGKGSAFTVTLPQKLIEGCSSVIGAETAASIRNFNYSKRRSAKPRLRRIPVPYAKVLVVDDVHYNLDVARGMMKPYKMKLDCVTSGQEAVDAIREEKVKYNAIFMDQMMPVMDGVEAVRIIREEIATEYAKTIPIIAFTANALAGSEEMFLSEGFQGFLSKPIESSRLDAVINQWIRDEEQDKLYAEEEEPLQYSGEERRSGKDRRKESVMSLLKGKIEGVDLQKGLERFNGDRDTFLDVMRSFALNTKQLLEIIRDVDEENLKDYAIHVHGVKSSCRGICCESLGSRAEALEKAAKAGDLAFVQENNTSFIESVLHTIGEIETALAGDKTQNVKLKKDKPYKEALLKLKKACDNYQIEIIDNTIKEIECFEYTDDDGLVLWLKENVDQMNYLEIAERISKLL